MIPNEQSYAFLPLEWWQQPLYIFGLCGGVLLGIAILFFCIKKYRRSRDIYTTRTYLLRRAQQLVQGSYADHAFCVHCYTELMRIVRDVSSSYYGIMIQGLTDEEFFEAIYASKESLSPSLIEYIECVCQEARVVKFAASYIAPATVKERVAVLITYIQELPEEPSQQQGA